MEGVIDVRGRKKIMAACLSVVILIACFSVQTEAAVRISKKKATIRVGKTLVLKIRGAKKVRWKSSNKKIAAVSGKGVVRGRKRGIATITAKVGKKSYKCRVTVKGVTPENKTGKNDMRETPHPVSADDGGDVAGMRSPAPNTAGVDVCGGKHVMQLTGVGAEPCADRKNVHLRYPIYRCQKCGYQEAGKEWTMVNCTFDTEPKVLRPATCEEEGYQSQLCVYCGKERERTNDDSLSEWDKMTVIPRTGHDFRYEYQEPIDVSEDWEQWGGFEKAINRAVENLGKRTAICKTCGKRYEEVGIDTGISLTDGTRAIAWGVWRKDKSGELCKRINDFRSTFKGDRREPLQESGDLDRVALYMVAASLQHHDIYNWSGEETILREWDKHYGRIERGKKNTDYDISTFQLDPIFQLYGEMKYIGAVYFELDLGDGFFIPGAAVLGNETEQCTWKCSHRYDESISISVEHIGGEDVGCRKCGAVWKCGHDSMGAIPDEKTGRIVCDICGYTVQYEWVVDGNAPLGEWRDPRLLCRHTDGADSTLLRMDKDLSNEVQAKCLACGDYFQWVGDDSEEGGFWQRS